MPLREVLGAQPVAPLLDIDGTGVVVEAVKLAEDRTGDVVVRLYESLGGRARARVTPSFDIASADVCDLLERADDAIARLAPCAVVDGVVTVELGPFQVVTLRLRPS